MPRVVGATMLFIMCMLMVTDLMPYFSMGCQSGSLRIHYSGIGSSIALLCSTDQCNCVFHLFCFEACIADSTTAETCP
jgi:hypothetical protein